MFWFMYVFERAYEFLYLSLVHKMLFDSRMLIGVSNGTKGQKFGMSLHLHPYFVYAIRAGSIRQCDKYKSMPYIYQSGA